MNISWFAPEAHCSDAKLVFVYKHHFHRKDAKFAKKLLIKTQVNGFAVFAPLRLCDEYVLN
jgi:hypothetical protein